MQTKAIIIKKQNINEYDQWVTCYTEDFGKLKAVAKSILKPSSIQSLHLDIFNLAEFELINGRGMPIITGAQVIEPFGEIKSSVTKTAVAYFFTEVVDKMVFENDKDEQLWSFLVSFLEELDRSQISGTSRILASLFREGQIKLLDILGYFPETDICRSCEDKLDEGNFGAFNHVLGGVVCKRCFLSGQGGILISREDFELLKGVASKLPEADLLEMLFPEGRLLEARRGFRRSVLDGMFEYISGNKFSSLELLSVLK